LAAATNKELYGGIRPSADKSTSLRQIFQENERAHQTKIAMARHGSPLALLKECSSKYQTIILTSQADHCGRHEGLAVESM